MLCSLVLCHVTLCYVMCEVGSGLWGSGALGSGLWALGWGALGLGLWVLGSGWQPKAGQNGTLSVPKWDRRALGAVWGPLSELLGRS
jgi:hypothetical protein